MRTLTVAAVAFITSGLVVTATAPAHAGGITNTESTAKSRCKTGDYDNASIEKKRSMSRTDGSGASTDPDIGTLYVIRVSNGDDSKHCVIAIKGGKTDGDFDYMTVTIGSDADSDWNGTTGQRKELIGPRYWDGDWDVARATLTEGSKRYEALIKP